MFILRDKSPILLLFILLTGNNITNWKHKWIGSINVLEFLLNLHKIPIKAIHNSSLLQMKAGSVDLNFLRRF